ncbi:outer arm dynein light chain 1 [Pelomyxa schiedti]|nr:outer arm dynein light chain 1 [Pelomyxa schiedti]
MCSGGGMLMTRGALFLHFKGFTNIGELDEYTGVKVLWLENNAISRIENLEKLVELRQLYLHHNLIENIENLELLTNLDTLNLCNNCIRKISGLKCLVSLHSLLLANNSLCLAEDLAGLSECPSIIVLDLSNNRIKDETVIEVLASLPNLGVLTLMGNPITKTIPNYRKAMIARIPTLKHLDDMPVFPSERRTVDAWFTGGTEAEAAERQKLHKEEHERSMRMWEEYENLVSSSRSHTTTPAPEIPRDHNVPSLNHTPSSPSPDTETNQSQSPTDDSPVIPSPESHVPINPGSIGSQQCPPLEEEDSAPDTTTSPNKEAGVTYDLLDVD